MLGNSNKLNSFLGKRFECLLEAHQIIGQQRVNERKKNHDEVQLNAATNFALGLVTAAEAQYLLNMKPLKDFTMPKH